MATICDNFGIDDIEDLCKEDDADVPLRSENQKSNYVPKYLRQKSKPRTINSQVETVAADSTIPGTQSVYIKTWGCAHNNSDSEYMAGQLASYGYKISDSEDGADCWLLNSCTVKNPAEDHFRNAVEKGISKGKAVVVAGCVPQGAPQADYINGLSIIGVQQIDRVVEVVEEALKGHSVRLLGTKRAKGKKSGGASLTLPKIRKNPLIEIIAINTGCLNQCTYCKTKHARGELGSYPIDEIVERATQSFTEGVREIWLTSEDTGAYGRDIGVTLPDLLWELVKVIPDGCRLRLGMTNPPYILDHLEEMAKILSEPKVYSFLHVPVQSASDSVLLDMKREYTRGEFQRVADFLKQNVPEITIATDIICGFPTESEEDFEDTMALVRQYQFPSLFINQFFPRPGTPAAKMTRIPPDIVKKRTKRLSELFQSYETYSHRLGQIQQVLVTEESHDKKYYVGHNKSYEQVLVPKNPDYLGKILTVKIVSTGKHFLKAEIYDSEAIQSPAVPEPLSKGQVSGVVPAASKMAPRTNNNYMYAFVAFVIAFLLRILLKYYYMI